MKWRYVFPISEKLSSYTREDGRRDLIAGITVAVMLVPQGMAYALLAGLPPIYGLYAGLIPLFIYAVLGTSRQMSVGPVAISAILVAAGISQLAPPMSAEYVSLVILAGVLIGILEVTLGFLRLGFLVRIITHPVILGFSAAAGIIIAINQLRDLLGIAIPRFQYTYETLIYAYNHVGQANWITVAICVSSMLFIFFVKKISRIIPGPLIAVIVCTLLIRLLGGDRLGVDLVGSVPEGLPAFQIPDFSWSKVMRLLPTVLIVTIIGIIESISIAKVLQAKHKNYKLRPNREFVALGFAKIGGAFFQAMPTSGSFTRSAVNDEAGARSGIASIITAALIGLTLLFLTPLFYYLPKAVLAAIILVSILKLFNWQEVVKLWKTKIIDFIVMLFTFILTLVTGIEIGVISGVIFSTIVRLVQRYFKI